MMRKKIPEFKEKIELQLAKGSSKPNKASQASVLAQILDQNISLLEKESHYQVIDDNSELIFPTESSLKSQADVVQPTVAHRKSSSGGSTLDEMADETQRHCIRAQEFSFSLYSEDQALIPDDNKHRQVFSFNLHCDEESQFYPSNQNLELAHRSSFEDLLDEWQFASTQNAGYSFTRDLSRQSSGEKLYGLNMIHFDHHSDFSGYQNN